MITNANPSGIRLYVGNLPYSYRTEDLFKMFADYGKVVDAIVMMEPDQQDRSKGFGFVTMAGQVEAETAAKAVQGKDILGRALVCNIAKPREPRFRF
jgi:RNA recognition motif-containing protein